MIWVVSYPLTLVQIGVKFGAMYEHSYRKRLFPKHFRGMIVSVFETQSRF
jgi:hypothetical protein